MTPNLKDLLNVTFYLMYHLGIPPSEIDRLSTHEMRSYTSQLSEKRKSENESEASTLKALANIFGLKKSKSR